MAAQRHQEAQSMTKILIIEDVLAMCKVYSKILTDHGYETHVAQDSDAAMQLYQSEKPDLVLIDITLPGKNGLETLAEIRQVDPNVRAIMLTALSQQQLLAQAMQLGAQDYLVKPVTPPQLLAAVDRVLG
jgi:two-component system chemotaxis response regulator CheY